MSGQGGHDATYSLVCRLLEKFAELRERDDDSVVAPGGVERALLAAVDGKRVAAQGQGCAVQGGEGDGNDHLRLAMRRIAQRHSRATSECCAVI